MYFCSPLLGMCCSPLESPTFISSQLYAKSKVTFLYRKVSYPRNRPIHTFWLPDQNRTKRFGGDITLHPHPSSTRLFDLFSPRVGYTSSPTLHSGRAYASLETYNNLKILRILRCQKKKQLLDAVFKRCESVYC